MHIWDNWTTYSYLCTLISILYGTHVCISDCTRLWKSFTIIILQLYVYELLALYRSHTFIIVCLPTSFLRTNTTIFKIILGTRTIHSCFVLGAPMFQQNQITHDQEPVCKMSLILLLFYFMPISEYKKTSL